nr:protein smg7 [Quercus suber]
MHNEGGDGSRLSKRTYVDPHCHTTTATCGSLTGFDPLKSHTHILLTVRHQRLFRSCLTQLSAGTNGSLHRYLRNERALYLHLTADLAAQTVCGAHDCICLCCAFPHTISPDSMEALLEEERAAEQQVTVLLRDRSRPIADMLNAMGHYRKVAELCIFTDFENAAKLEDRLWLKHTEGRKYFHRALSNLRRADNQEELVVAKRQCGKLFLYFLKDSHRFYQNFVQTLHATYPQVSELDLVVRGLKVNDSSESSQPLINPQLRSRILNSCHRVLIYIGDLSRYRAAEKLDEKPDYARAIGYYGLACSFRPSSGHGHHQQAVIFLEQRKHLSAVYELYRATVVDEPHPLAISNLEIEFDKIKEAKDKGGLLKPGHPKDPDSHKNALVGWFVYLHGECFKGEIFSEYEALEREFLGQLAKLLTNDTRDQSRLLSRVVMTFTLLLRLFQDSMAQRSAVNTSNETLASKLTPMAYRLLPVLRLYSVWLLPMVVLIDGLSGDEFIKPAVDGFWPTYTHAMDLICQTFPIWEFDDEPTVTYLLEEDAESLAFKPLVDEKTLSIWFDKFTGVQKPYCYDPNIRRLSVDTEMLARVQSLLNCAVALAEDDDCAPLRLHGTRFLFGDEKLPEPAIPAVDAEKQRQGTNSKVQQPTMKSKPLTYAAAASAPLAAATPLRSRQGHRSLNGASKSVDQTQDESLTRMVDNLLDGDENHPVTPPQQHISYPAVADDAPGQHNACRDSAQDLAPLASYPFQSKPLSRPMSLSSPPETRTPRSPGNANPSSDRLQSVSNIWAQSPLLSATSQFPSGLPAGTLSSPAHGRSNGHTRVNSANSIRSNTSQNANDLWSSLESSRQLPGLPTIGQSYSKFKSNVGSPVLFGAGAGPWSSWSPGVQPTRESVINATPPNGQGG